MSTGAPVEQGQPIRYPAVSLMLVNSDDQKKYDSNGFRIDTTKPNQIYINKQRPIMFGYMTRLALTEMNIIWDVYNVNSYNNTLTLQLFTATDASPPVVASAGFIQIDLVNGYYTPDELATAVASAINATGLVIATNLSFSVVYDDSDCSFLIEQTATYASTRVRGYFKLISGSAPQSLTGEAPVDDDLLYLMGLEPTNINTAVAPGTSYSKVVGGYAPMFYTPYIDVVSNLLTKNQNVSDGTTTTIVASSKLARIYFSNENIALPTQALSSGSDEVYPSNLIGTKPCTFRREFKMPKQIQWNATENVDVIDIQVLDYKQRPVPINEGFSTSSTNVLPSTNKQTLFQSNNTQFQFTIQASEN